MRNGYTRNIIKKKEEGDYMTVEEMNGLRKQLGISYALVSEYSGVPLGTVQKVLGGITKKPRLNTMLAIGTAIHQLAEKADMMSKDLGNYSYVAGEIERTERMMKEGVSDPMIKEPLPYTANSDGCDVEERQREVRSVRKKAGGYTLEDYYRLPDDQRVELIDGTFYDMAAPRIEHQLACMRIRDSINRYIEKNKGNCIVFDTPIDVQLDQNNTTVVQPDVTIICDRSKIRGGRIFGAPDLVVEVLSASTRKKDMTIKQAKYAQAGVKEYWIIDLDKEKVIVYDYTHDYNVTIYSIEDAVPVGIYDGKCMVDFAKIKEYIDGVKENDYE